ncbi:hypothetical protein HDU67_008324 [Dinochytrium kinnereticum]|nr:hypothetical protein HDU67_008324 [Dinochytrium kinnereticum]
MSELESSQTEEERKKNEEKKRKFLAEDAVYNKPKRYKEENGRLRNFSEAEAHGNLIRGRDSFDVKGALRTKPGRSGVRMGIKDAALLYLGLSDASQTAR